MEWPPTTVQPASTILDSVAVNMRSRKSRSPFWGNKRMPVSERASAHGVDVTERVCGGDLSEGVRVVHDGSEEVDGLNKCGVGPRLGTRRLVGEFEAD